MGIPIAARARRPGLQISKHNLQSEI
jgi:hypothetical protein